MFEWLARQTRRLRTGYPTSITAEDHNSWLSEQIRAYATPQPYAAPLTSSGDNWTGETWEIREGYRRYALKEPSVKAALLTKILAVAQLDLVVTPYDNANRHDREIAQWVKWSVTRVKGGIAGLIWNIGFHALVDGFSVTEKVIDVIPDDSPKYAGFWTMAQAKTKDSRGIRFRLDTFKNVVGVRSMVAAQGGQDFSPADFIVFTHLPLFQSPFGVSDLRAANRAANLIEAAVKLRAILLENFSGPYLVGKAADKGTRDQIMEILKVARARGWIVIPEGASVEVINLATSAPDQFQNTIEDLRQEIVTAIQGAYLQLLEGGVTDGRGNTQVHKGVAELFQWFISTCVSSSLNDSLVADLVFPNYGRSVGLPTCQFGGIDPAAISAELDRFAKGQQLGKTLSAKQVSEVGGFDSAEDDADKLVPLQIQILKLQQQSGQGGGSGGGPDLSSLFGPDNPSGGNGIPDAGAPVQLEPPKDNATQFADRAPYREYSQSEYDALSFADRSHLVKKIVQDKNGLHRTVWVNPNTGDHGDEATRLKPRTDAEAAVARALASPAAITPAEFSSLGTHLKVLTSARKREILRSLQQKLGGNKVELAARILAHVSGRSATAPAPSPPPPPPPVAPPPPEVARSTPEPLPRGLAPAGMPAHLLSSTTYAQLAEVIAGRLPPERVRDQLAQRLLDNGNPEIIRSLASHYLTGLEGAPAWADVARLPFPRQSAIVASHVLAHAVGRPVPTGSDPVAARPAPAAPPPPPRPSPAPTPAPTLTAHEFTTPGAVPLPSDPPRAVENVNFAGGEEATKRTLREFFGRDVDPKIFAALVNAHDGARVSVSSYGGNLSVETRGDGYNATRTVRRDRDGTIYVKNNYFRVEFNRAPNPNPPPKWNQSNPEVSGSALLANQIRAARALGAAKLKTHAARADAPHPNDGMNGYYTWPRLGYDDSIPGGKWDKLSREKPELAALVTSNPTGSTVEKSVLNLMTTEEGRKWWQKYGDDLFDMEFDLKHDSLSMRTAVAYAKEQAGTRSARAANPPNPPTRSRGR